MTDDEDGDEEGGETQAYENSMAGL